MRIKVFELLAMISSLSITPSPERDRGNGPETRPGIKPSGRGDVIPNLPALAGTLALQGGEEVRKDKDFQRIADYGLKLELRT
jgi:hypothetical protein